MVFNHTFLFVAFMYLALCAVGCVTGSKGVDLADAKGIDATSAKLVDMSKPTNNEQRSKVTSTAGDNSQITTINIIGQNSGWIVGGLSTVGWGTAWLGRRRSTKAVDRLVRAIDSEDQQHIKERVKEMGKLDDRTEAHIKGRVRAVCR